MDVRFFLNRRLAFIRQFYVTASEAYVERKRKIEAEEEPFIPPYSEDSEPAFLEEWIEADESLQVLGRSCLSMLAATLHLYFKTWERQIGIAVDESKVDRLITNQQSGIAACCILARSHVDRAQIMKLCQQDFEQMNGGQ